MGCVPSSSGINEVSLEEYNAKYAEISRDILLKEAKDLLQNRYHLLLNIEYMSDATRQKMTKSFTDKSFFAKYPEYISLQDARKYPIECLKSTHLSIRPFENDPTNVSLCRQSNDLPINNEYMRNVLFIIYNYMLGVKLLEDRDVYIRNYQYIYREVTGSETISEYERCGIAMTMSKMDSEKTKVTKILEMRSGKVVFWRIENGSSSMSSGSKIVDNQHEDDFIKDTLEKVMRLELLLKHNPEYILTMKCGRTEEIVF